MKEDNIRKYAELMKELDLTGLEITDEDIRIRLEREILLKEEQRPVKAEKKSISGFEVVSPTVGIFYSAPAEDAESFVKQGDLVKTGDTLCIIETMKLMNEISAERSGIIEEICVSDGQAVEYGTVLFRLVNER